MTSLQRWKPWEITDLHWWWLVTGYGYGWLLTYNMPLALTALIDAVALTNRTGPTNNFQTCSCTGIITYSFEYMNNE